MRDMNVFIVIPSPINHHVNNAYELIPKANPKNLPGHSNPSKYSKEYLVAKIKT